MKSLKEAVGEVVEVARRKVLMAVEGWRERERASGYWKGAAKEGKVCTGVLSIHSALQPYRYCMRRRAGAQTPTLTHAMSML